MQKNLSLGMAKAIAEGTIAACKANGFQHVGGSCRSRRTGDRDPSRRAGNGADS
jgi:hypothetical protein